MHVKHPNGMTEVFMEKHTNILAEMEIKSPQWVTFQRFGDTNPLFISDTEWKAFFKLVKEINERMKDD